MITWTCHICHKERPDAAISVRTVDRSREIGQPTGTFKENIRYCNDNASCHEKALARGASRERTTR